MSGVSVRAVYLPNDENMVPAQNAFYNVNTLHYFFFINLVRMFAWADFRDQSLH